MKKSDTNKSLTTFLQITNTFLKRGVLLILLMIGFSSTLFAQITIKGNITDSNNEPLPGASVVIKGTTVGTTADANGNYSFTYKKNVNSITLQVSFMGYKTIERKIALDGKVAKTSFQMEQADNELNEVTVTAKSEAQKLREIAIPVAVISLDELKGIAGGITDIVSKTSGVQMRRSGAVGSQARFSLRGLEGRRIGYFKDGVSLGNNETYDLDQIPVDFIDHVEVYKGIVPAKLGGNAMGGAINLVTRDYPPTYADVEYKIGSFNTHDLTFTFIRNKNGYEIGAGGGYTYADNNYKMELPLQKGTYITRDHDQYQKFCMGLGLTVNNNWWFDEVNFEPLIVWEKKQVQGIEYNIQEAEKVNKVLGITNKITHKNLFTEGLDLEMNNGFTYANNTFVDSASVRYGWDGTPYAPVSALGGEISGYNTDNVVFSALQHTNLEYTINAHHLINFNSQYNYARSLPEDKLREELLGYAQAFNSTMNTWVGGLNYEFNSKNLKFTNSATVRLYYYSMKTQAVEDLGLISKDPVSVTNEKFDYGISDAIRYKFTPEFLVKLALGYDLRLPSVEELVGDGFTVDPSEVLDPERNTSANLGFMYDVNYSGRKRFQVEVNAFAMYLEDMIKLSGGALQSKYENFGEMRTLGTDLDIKWDAIKWLYLWGNVTYQDLRDTREYSPGSTVANPTKGERMPNIPYFFWNAGLELHKENFFGGKGQNSRFYADCSYIEKYYYNFELSKYQDKSIPQSFTINAGVEQSFCDRTIFVKFEVKNITDEQVFSELNRPLPGRNFQGTLRYIWK